MLEETPKNIFELSVYTKDLVHALSFANSVVEKRNVMLELSNIKLIAKPGIIEICATDMDLYLNQEIGAEVIISGQTTVATQTLSEIMRKIPDLTVKLVQTEGSDKLEIIGAKCRFELLTLLPAQFPAMEDVNSTLSLSIPSAELARLIECTNFSISTEETRYNLAGIFMRVREHEFLNVSTDGHRLSIASVDIKQKMSDFGVIVPKKTVNELLKILKDSKNSQAEVEIFLSDTKVKFKCNNIIFISKLIDGTFPEYKSFIPLNKNSKLLIKTKLLADAIDRVAIITVDKFRAIKFSFEDNALQITASGEAKGAAIEILEYSQEEDNFCQYSDDAKFSIGFNPKYLSDIFAAIKEQKVEIFFQDSFSPVLIKMPSHPNDSFVVMPVKV